MDDFEGNMIIVNTGLDCEEKKVPVDFVEVNEEVSILLPDETKRSVSNGATYLEPPPVYCERDPLQSENNENELVPEGVNHGTMFGSVSSDSTGSFSDDDDDDVIDAAETGPSWSELDTCGRVKRVMFQWLGKAIGLLGLLYIFICSLDFLSSAFRILGGKTAGGVFTNNDLLSNPVAGLMIGILATVLVQSSSTSTSIIVTMVASGIMEVSPAIPMIMGANIGTSVTNTVVSMAQSSDRREFKRAFAGATVHDMFNWLSVLVLLPLECATGYLYRLTKVITEACKMESYSGGKQELLKALTKPFTSLLVQVDKKVISKIAEGHEDYLNKSLIKKYCTFDEVEIVKNVTVEANVTSVVNGEEHSVLVNITEEVVSVEKIPIEKCFSLFSHLEMNETAAGVLILTFSLFCLCMCLVLMVKLLHSILQGSIAKVIKKTLNSDFPGCFSWLTGYVAMLVGALMTILVQSSSVFTSALTPLVGIGMIKLDRMYPLTLGSNLGTTGTGILAAMAASGDKLPVALQISLCHLFFNISGIILFYPIKPMRRIPIKCAKFLGKVTSKYRWFAIFYLILMFVVLPGCVFLLSLAGIIPSIIAAAIAVFILLFVVIVNIMQRKCPNGLPKILRTWENFPEWSRSLQPLDNKIMAIASVIKKCCPCCLKCCEQKKPDLQAKLKSAGLASINICQKHTRNSSPAASTASSTLLMSERVYSSRL